jgi:cell filamentation protein
MGKGDFQFAAARQIRYCLKELESKYLKRYTPCNLMNDEQLIEAIAIVHVEFVLVHPFRDGNGRIARLLANVMALQANKPELDYSSWDASRDDYFLTIQAGMDNNYEPVKAFVRQALADAVRGSLDD